MKTNLTLILRISTSECYENFRIYILVQQKQQTYPITFSIGSYEYIHNHISLSLNKIIA